jgi:hypothetical protein
VHNFTGYEPDDRIRAVAKRPLTFIPARLDAVALADVLDRLDLPLPKEVQALRALGEPYGRSGHQISIRELDKALSATTLKTEEKIKLKLALASQGLLPDAPPLAMQRTGR